MKSMAVIAGAVLMAAAATTFGNEADVDRRLQKLEAAMERIEARLAKLEASKPAAGRGGETERRGMMGGDRPNEQWRGPESKK